MDDDEDVDDHVPVLYDQRAYILVRNPAANGGGGAGVSAPPPAASPEGSKVRARFPSLDRVVAGTLVGRFFDCCCCCCCCLSTGDDGGQRGQQGQLRQHQRQRLQRLRHGHPQTAQPPQRRVLKRRRFVFFFRLIVFIFIFCFFLFQSRAPPPARCLSNPPTQWGSPSGSAFRARSIAHWLPPLGSDVTGSQWGGGIGWAGGGAYWATSRRLIFFVFSVSLSLSLSFPSLSLSPSFRLSRLPRSIEQTQKKPRL